MDYLKQAGAHYEGRVCPECDEVVAFEDPICVQDDEGGDRVAHAACHDTRPEMARMLDLANKAIHEGHVVSARYYMQRLKDLAEIGA